MPSEGAAARPRKLQASTRSLALLIGSLAWQAPQIPYYLTRPSVRVIVLGSHAIQRSAERKHTTAVESEFMILPAMLEWILPQNFTPIPPCFAAVIALSRVCSKALHYLPCSSSRCTPGKRHRPRSTASEIFSPTELNLLQFQRPRVA